MLRFLKFENELINPDLIVFVEFKPAKHPEEETVLNVDFSAPCFNALPINNGSCYRRVWEGEEAKHVWAYLCKESVELTPRKKREYS